MNWEALFERFSSLKVLVLGDLMVDSYLFGKVDRISPEAPVPVVSLERRESRLGGAANVALNLRALGAQVDMVSVIGWDEQGTILKGLLEKENIGTRGIHSSQKRKTTVKFRVIGNNHQMLRVDEEDLHGLEKEEKDLLTDWVKKHISGYQVLVFEDYDKGVLDEELIQAVQAIADAHQVPTVVDPKKRNFLAYKGVTLFKPNLKEIREGLKLDNPLKDEGALKEAVKELATRLEAKIIMVTLSERGVAISNRDKWVHLPAHVRNISDVSGAGDTVISVAALCLALECPVSEIAFLSNLAGGLVCEKVGVVPVEKAKLLEEAIKLS